MKTPSLMKNIFLTSALGVILSLPAKPAFAASAGTVIQLAPYSIYNFSPSVQNGQVAWSGYDGNQYQIFLYDGIQTRQLTNDNIFNKGAPSIHGGQVAWRGYDGQNYVIFLWDGLQIRQLANSSSYKGNPSIQNGQVVWEGNNGFWRQVFLYDGVQTRQLSSNTSSNYGPSIDNGQVVWIGGNGHTDVFLYDGSRTIQLTNNGFVVGFPSIQNGQVVWTGLVGQKDEVFLYDGVQVRQISDNAYSNVAPSIYNGQVVWMGGSQSGDIFLYDGAQTRQLSNNLYVNVHPSINNGQVVWVGHNGQDYEIFLYDGDKTRQLTNASINSDFPPKIDHGDVVWEGNDGTDYGIFLYRPSALTVSNIGDGERIRVRWSDVSPDGKNWRYNVWRKDASIPEAVAPADWRTAYVLVSSGAVSAVKGEGEFLDGLRPSVAPARGVIYDYKVEAVDPPGVSSTGMKPVLGPKKGVAEPFVMLVRGYGADEQGYWSTYQDRLIRSLGPDRGMGFRITPGTFDVNGSTYSKPKTLWDTALFEHGDLVYPGGLDNRIGQLDPKQTGPALVEEIRLWLAEARQSNQKDAEGNTVLDWTPETFSVISHSMGAPTSRYLANLLEEEQAKWKEEGSDPDKFMPTIAKNVMLSPANLGASTARTYMHTPAAFVGFVNWFSEKKQSWPASKFLQPEEVARFNKEVRPSDRTDYSILSGDSWRGGGFDTVKHRLAYFLGNMKLIYAEADGITPEFIEDTLSPEMRNDGAVTVKMQRGSFTNKVWDELKRNHGYSEPRTEWEFHPSPAHLQVPASLPMNHFQGLVKCDGMVGRAWSALDASPRYPEDATAALCTPPTPNHTDELLKDTRIQDEGGGTLLPGDVKTRIVSIPTVGRWASAVIWEGPAGSARVTLTAPDGTVIDGASGVVPPGVEYQSDDGAVLYFIANPPPGDWVVTIRGVNAPAEGALYADAQLTDAPYLTQTPFAGKEAAPGEEVVLAIDLSANTGKFNSAAVTAEVVTEAPATASFAPTAQAVQTTQTLTLFDDALHGDGAAGDGVYGALFTAPSSTGTVSVRYSVNAVNTSNQKVSLSALSGFPVVIHGALAVDSVSAERAVQGSGKITRLEVDAQVSFSGSAPYTLLADMVDPSGAMVARGEARIPASSSSPATATLVFNGEEIAAAAKDGPYTVKDFFLFQSEGIDKVYDRALTWQTQPYAASQFPLRDADGDGLPDAVEGSLGTDPSLRDTDGDGRTDYAEVSLDGDPSDYTPGVDTDPLTWDMEPGVDVTPPTVNIVWPVPGVPVRGVVDILAGASDDQNLTLVDFFVDGVPRSSGTANPSASWDTTAGSDGEHVVRVVAYDAAGNSAEQSVIATVDNTPPAVTISSPAAGAFASSTVTVTAQATDAFMALVEFSVDGVVRSTDTTSPYTYAWNTSFESDGLHTLQATAFDAAGNSAVRSSTVTVDNNAPTVAITSPPNGYVVTGSGTVQATAADAVGVAGVRFFVDGQPLGAEDTVAPYTAFGDSTQATTGNHTLTAVARDASGKTRTSAPVTIRVDNFGQAKINFQPSSATAPSGYLVDGGGVYGSKNGRTYGWTAVNGNAFDRNAAGSPDQRYDTLIYTRLNGISYTWEIAVPNGVYSVRVVAGDPTTTGPQTINVEGLPAINGTTTTAAPWIDRTGTVTVGDGRLTISNPTSNPANSALCFIEVTAAQ